MMRDCSPSPTSPCPTASAGARTGAQCILPTRRPSSCAPTSSIRRPARSARSTRCCRPMRCPAVRMAAPSTRRSTSGIAGMAAAAWRAFPSGPGFRAGASSRQLARLVHARRPRAPHALHHHGQAKARPKQLRAQPNAGHLFAIEVDVPGLPDVEFSPAMRP